MEEEKKHQVRQRRSQQSDVIWNIPFNFFFRKKGNLTATKRDFI